MAVLQYFVQSAERSTRRAIPRSCPRASVALFVAGQKKKKTTTTSPTPSPVEPSGSPSRGSTSGGTVPGRGRDLSSDDLGRGWPQLAGTKWVSHWAAPPLTLASTTTGKSLEPSSTVNV